VRARCTSTTCLACVHSARNHLASPYAHRVRVAIILVLVLTNTTGCRPKQVTCSSFAVDHANVPSKLPTSFVRDLATAKFSTCEDGHTYRVRCRHGTLHTECTCAIDDVDKLESKRKGRMPDDQAGAVSFANETCNWKLR